MDFPRLYECLPKDPSKWSVADTETWLSFIGLKNLFPQFKKAAVDGSCLTALTEDDLRNELNIRSGITIKKIISWISKGLLDYSEYVKMRIGGAEMQEPILNRTDNRFREIKRQPQVQQPLPRLISTAEEQPKTNFAAQIPLSEEIESSREISTEFQLIMKQVDGTGNSFYSVKETGARIGRHNNNQIVLLEDSVSRSHAQINFKNDQFFIRDVGSTTGTFIKLDQRMELYNGMVVQMGSNQFQFEILPEELRLFVIEGLCRDKEIVFSSQSSSIQIGRRTTNELHFADDQHLSNVHAKITRLGNRYFIEDMSTTNGTWQRLSMQAKESKFFPLGSDSSIRISSNLIFECKVKKSVVQVQSSSEACSICFSSERDCVFMPCKHNATCLRCGKSMSACPICRTDIEEMIRIYRS